MTMTDQVSMTVLVIDDDAHIRSSIGKFLIARGHTVIEAANGEKGVEVLESQAVDIVITDVKMPGMDGFEVLRRMRSIASEIEVIVITGVKESENAFRALREGAFDFFSKPFKVEDLNAAIQRTVRYQVLRKETDRMQARLDRLVAQERERSGLNAIIGESEAVVKMKAQILQVAVTDHTTVLIVGETGKGKELIARAVHCESDRAGGPFVPVSCSAIPGNVRMLKNAVERAAILCEDGEIDADDLGFDLVERSPIAETPSIPAESVVDQMMQSLSE